MKSYTVKIIIEETQGSDFHDIVKETLLPSMKAYHRIDAINAAIATLQRMIELDLISEKG